MKRPSEEGGRNDTSARRNDTSAGQNRPAGEPTRPAGETTDPAGEPTHPAQDSTRLANEPIRAALRELGERESEIEPLADLLAQLRAECAVEVDPESTRRLVERLAPLLPADPATAAATAATTAASTAPAPLPERDLSIDEPFLYFLRVAYAQMRILQLDFWLYSVFVTLLGGLLTLPGLPLSNDTILWLVAPVLAVLGVHHGFRSDRYKVSELEAAAPISPLRLALARLLVILCYDTLLMGALSLFLARLSGGAFSTLILHWLAPLVLVTGIALALSLRFALRPALTVGYTIWMAFVGLAHSAVTLPDPRAIETGLLLLGLALMAAGVVGKQRTVAARETGNG